MREPGGMGTGEARRGRKSQRAAESEEQGSEWEPRNRNRTLRKVWQLSDLLTVTVTVTVTVTEGGHAGSGLSILCTVY